MRRWRVVLVGVGVAVLAGALAPSAGAVSSGNAADKAIATTGVLVASDLPATYTSSPRDASSDDTAAKLAAKIPSCTKVIAFMKAVKKFDEVKSDEFTSGQTEIDNTVTIFPNAAQAKAAVDAYSATGVPACFSKLVGKVASQAGGAAKGEIKKVKDVVAGDQSVAYEGPVTVTEKDGSTATLGFGELAIRIGRGVAVYSYNHDANTSIAAELKTAVENSGSRLQSALGA